MEKELFHIEFVSYHKWNDFGFNLLPNIYFLRDDDEDGLRRTFGIGWFCWSIELVWLYMSRRKKYKVGDRIFYTDYKGDIASAIVLGIEDREMDTDIYGRPAKKPVKYKLYRTGNSTFIEDYNCLPENDPRVVKYKDGRMFITPNFREQLVDWLTAHGAHKGDQDVSEILYDLSVEYE